jgi:spore coat protein CotH
LGLLGLILNSCYKEQIIAQGEGLSDWSTSTHGSTAIPNYELVFNNDEVQRLDIVIDPKYWEIMTNNLENLLGVSGQPTNPGPPQQQNADADEDGSGNPVYVPCSVFHDGKEWYYVGIRFKGNSSLRTVFSAGIKKMPFRLEFDQFADDYPQITGQTFYGFGQLSLGNNFNDMSLMREKTAHDLFREFGVPAPHTAFYRVYVDYGDGPIYFGLYTLVEIVFDTMLEKQFGSNSGNCYKPENDGSTFAFGSFNTSDLSKKTNQSLADWSDLEQLYNILHDDSRTSQPAEWRSNLEQVFDVYGFLRWLAANTAMQNWDTYGKMTHNYYLYHDPADDLIKWIPWDSNEALMEGKMGGTLSISLNEVTEKWPLISFIMDQPEYEAVYKTYLLEFINTVFEPSKMQNTYQQQYDLIKPYVVGTDGETEQSTFLKSDADFDNALTELKNHVSLRKAVVEGYAN